MSHTLDDHIHALDSLCRICGKTNYSSKQKKSSHLPKLCETISDDIFIACRLDTKSDKANKHSRFVCCNCKRAIQNAIKRQSKATITRLETLVKDNDAIWTDYSESNSRSSCSSCNHRQETSRGIVRNKNVPAPPTLNQTNQSPINTHSLAHDTVQVESDNCINTTSTLLDYSTTPIATSTPIANTSYPSADQQYLSFTDDLLDNPYESHVHCETRPVIAYNQSAHHQAITHTDDNLGLFPLATDRTAQFWQFSHNSSDVRLSPQAVTPDTQQYAGTSSYISVSRPDYSAGPSYSRECNQSSEQSNTNASFPNETESIDEYKSIHKAEPLTKKEEQLLTSLMKRKLARDPNNQIVKCVTRGQPLVFQRIVVPRKQTTDVKTPTKKKRARLIQGVRKNIAGKTSSDAQRATELKLIPRCRRQEIFKKAGGKSQINVDAQQVLIMNETLGLSSRKGRIHSKLLKNVGVRLEGEGKIKHITRAIVEDFVQCKLKTFHKEDCSEAEEVPYTKIRNIPKFLDKMLDAYEDKNMLTWHDGTIPENEVWVKLGGDHGKHSLKLTMEIANTQAPNSKLNTVVIAFAPIKDTHANLISFLEVEGGLLDEITQLQTHTWKGKSIKLFLNGDYEFLSKVYGISGANGTYPCVYCLVTRNKIHSKMEPCQLRTLTLLKADSQRYINQEKVDKSLVSNFNNCLHSPLFPIDLTHACPPYLHITLGIILRHHKNLEKEAHKLDIKLLNQYSSTLTEKGQTLKTLGANWKKAKAQEAQIYLLKHYLIMSDTETDRNKYRKDIEEAENVLSGLEFAEFTDTFSGPVGSSLDSILTEHRITPQKYHSRSFTGNHCHKYISSEVYKSLTQEIVSQVTLFTNCPFIIDEAHVIKIKFDNLNNAFQRVHKAISHSKPINTDLLEEYQNLIDHYIEIYRRLFPNTTIPKQHILEHHCIPHIKQHGFGLGLMGEQGTEASHQSIALIEQRARGIVDPLKRGKFILETHILNTYPHLRP